MQNKPNADKKQNIITEITSNKSDKFAIETKETKNKSGNKDLATYRIQNSLSCLYVKRIYLAFRDIKNFRYLCVDINSEKAFTSDFQQDIQAQSIQDLQLRLKDNKNNCFFEVDQIITHPALYQKNNKRQLLEIILEKLRSGRQNLEQGENRLKKGEYPFRKQYKSSTPDFYAEQRRSFSKQKDSPKFYEEFQTVNLPNYDEHCQSLIKLLIKEILEIKKQLFHAKKTTAILDKGIQTSKLINFNKNIESISQIQITTPRQIHEQEKSAVNQKKNSLSKCRNQNQKKLNKSTKSEQNQPRVIINHIVHNYYTKQIGQLKLKHNIQTINNPHSKKQLNKSIETIKQNHNSNCEDSSIGNTIQIQKHKKKGHSRARSNFCTSIRSRCTGIPEQQINEIIQ